jgi:hypothetical protein
VDSKFVKIIVLIIVGLTVSSGCSGVARWIRTGKISGRVVDHDGNAVENAKIALKDRYGRTVSDLPDSCEKGGFTFKNVRYGQYIVETVADGYATSYRRANLKFGSSLHLEVILYRPFLRIQSAIDSSLSGLGRITGDIIDLNSGKGISCVTVSLGKTYIGTVSRNDGGYAIPEIPPAEYTLLAQSIGYDKMEIENLSISSNELLEISFGMSPRIEDVW